MMSDCACKLIRKTHCGQGTLWKELADLEVKYLDRAPWSRLGWAGQGRAEAMALTGNLSVGRGERIDSSAQAEFRPERSEPQYAGICHSVPKIRLSSISGRS